MMPASSGSQAHDRLISEVTKTLERVPAKDEDIARLLRVALAALRQSVGRASAARDPEEARFLWTFCAQSESALQAALRELWRRRRMSRGEYVLLQEVVASARRHRNQAFLEVQRAVIALACN